MAGCGVAGRKTAVKAALLAEKMSLDPVGQGIEAEVGDPEQPTGSLEHMVGEDAQLCPQAEIGHREVRRRRNQRHHVLKTDIGQKPDVFQLIRLFDEPDRLLDRPSCHVALHGPPETFSCSLQREVRQEHQRLFPKAPHDHQIQRILVTRESDGTMAELDPQAPGLVSFLLNDRFQIEHRTALGDLQNGPGAALINEMTVFSQADQESTPVMDHVPEKFIPVAAPIHHPDATSLGPPTDRLDGLLDLLVLAPKLRTPLGVKTIIEGKDRGLSRFGADDLESPVTVGQPVFAPVAHSRQILHPFRILLADVREVQDQQREFLDPGGGHPAERRR